MSATTPERAPEEPVEGLAPSLRGRVVVLYTNDRIEFMPNERAGSLCVFCRRQPVDAAWRPFCSERCRLQDLAQWADGAYRVPAEQADARRSSGEHDADDDPETS
jgi:endogenous inhibitor of DNA gyrase (YacG/DUF329 family)